MMQCGRVAVILMGLGLAVGCGEDEPMAGSPSVDGSMVMDGGLDGGLMPDGMVEPDGMLEPDGRVAPDGMVTPDGMLEVDGMPNDSAVEPDGMPIDSAVEPDGMRVADDGVEPDGMIADGGVEPDAGGPEPVEVIRGRFESAGPVRNCGQLAQWQAPDGFLLRMRWDVCGDDMAALAATILANLDAAEARGGRALLNISQGPFLPASWTAECETFRLEDMRFQGDVCLPWDPAYQARLRAALTEQIGPAVAGHPALAGVYFTISTMTNGSEMHFRVPRSDFDVHPGDAAFTRAYIDVMDIFIAAFEAPILMEVGHCIFADPPGGAVEPVDCETPRAVYRHARDTVGPSGVGVAVWNCAERFWWGPDAIEDQTRPLLEEAVADGVSFGCQTVANFTDDACRFSDPAVGDYGDPIAMPGGDCPDSASYDPVAACVDTMRWFAGVERQVETSVALRGTWAELWSVDVRAGGVYRTSEACGAAVDLLAP